MNQEGSARRTFGVVSYPSPLTPHSSSALRLSEAAMAFLRGQENEAGNCLRTLGEYRTAIWYVIEFAGRDLRVEELPEDFARRWIEWLRMTLARPRKPWSRPKQITPETVARELAHPAERREGEGIVRREQTVGRYWRHGRTFLASLGLSVKLPKKRGRRGTSRDYAPRMTLPPPLVPRRAEVVGWWRQTLDPHSGQLKTRQALRRRVVLMQGLDLLTGCRIGELLQAETQYLEGHWLLLHPEAVKTRWPRMLYLTCQALAIAQELRRWTPTGQKEMFDVRGQGQRFAGWTQSVSWWHKQVKRCLPQPNLPKGEADKRHQGLRRICSTWLHRRDPIAEAAQLGHGRGDVVSAHYLDVLRRLPRCMDRKPMRLPELEGFTWPTPIEAEQHVPKRLYAEFKRMVQE